MSVTHRDPQGLTHPFPTRRSSDLGLDPKFALDDRNVVLAALGPKMLELARDRTKGALPYNVTPEHTAMARDILGPDRLLCVEQKICLTTDAAAARASA